MKIKSYKLEDNPEGIKEIYVEDYNSRSVFEYNILNHINPDEIQEWAEYRGFTVTNIELDDTDQQLLDDILAVFEASNWAERKEIRDKICGKN